MNAHDYSPNVVRMLSKVCVTVSFDSNVSADIMCYEGARHARREKVRGTWCHVDELFKCARFVKRRSEEVPVIVVDGGKDDLYEGLIDYEMVSDEVLVNGMKRCKVLGFEYVDEVEDCNRNCMGCNSISCSASGMSCGTGADMPTYNSLIQQIGSSSSAGPAADMPTHNSLIQQIGSSSPSCALATGDRQTDNTMHVIAMEECSNDNPQPSFVTPLMHSLKHFKGIKDLKTCTISTGYSFKVPKTGKLKRCERLVRIRLSERFDGGVFFISNVVVKDALCILNVRFGERMDEGLVDDRENCGGDGKNRAIPRRNEDRGDGCVSGSIDEMDMQSSRCTDVEYTEDDSTASHATALQGYSLEYGMFFHSVTPYFTANTSSSVFKLQDRSLKSGVVSFNVPYTPTNTPLKLFHNQNLVLSSNTYDHKERVILEKRVITGKPYKVYGTWCKIKNMFNCRDDVLFFRCVKLVGRGGNVGWIRSSVGVKGVFKAEFERPVKQGEVIRMCVYRLVEVV